MNTSNVSFSISKAENGFIVGISGTEFCQNSGVQRFWHKQHVFSNLETLTQFIKEIYGTN